MGQIGNKSIFVLLCIMLTSTLQAPRITLTSTDMRGFAPTNPRVGVPFILHAVLTDVPQDTNEKPNISGSDQYFIQEEGANLTVKIVNGHTSVTKDYRYVMRIDQEGQHTIGPASVTINGALIQSEPLSLYVRTTTPQDTQQEAQNAPATLHIAFDKQEVFLGQKVTFTIRATPQPRVSFEQIDEPILAGFINGGMRGPIITPEYQEWHWDLYPNETGKLVVPALNARIAIQEDNRHAFFGLLAKREIVQSNALTLTVKPLEHPVDGVGQFSDFNAELSASTTQQHEGVVLTLSITGKNAYLDTIKLSPQLPDSVRAFTSKKSVNAHTLRAEFIVQPTLSGVYTIPVQQFSYFDPDDQQYKTLLTQPVTLTVTPVILPEPTQEQAPEPALLRQGFEGLAPEPEQIRRVWAGARTCNQTLSWPIFWVLFILPVLIQVIRWSMIWHTTRTTSSSAYKRAQALAHARIELTHTQKINNSAQLHLIFAKLTPHVPINKRSEWQEFDARLTQCAFSGSALEQPEIDALFAQAQHWLNVLEQEPS